jgi:hypothetical protein
MNTQPTFQSSLHDHRENQSRTSITQTTNTTPCRYRHKIAERRPRIPSSQIYLSKNKPYSTLPLPGQIAEGLDETFPAKAEQVSPIIGFRLKPEAIPVGGSRDVGPLATQVNS